MPNFKIDDTPIKNPTKFRIERYNITTLERLANADMAGDYIASKSKFLFTYDFLEGSEWTIILGLLWGTATLFHTLKYYEDGSGDEKSASVYVGDMPADLHKGGMAEWVWKDVTFNLIQK
jgi:hypothetical protein